MGSTRRVRGLDTLVRARVVRILVRGGGGVVGDIHRLDVHGERGLAIIRQATGPFDGALIVAGVAAGPDADSKTHGCLWEVGAADCVRVVEGADGVAVDEPHDGFRGPIDSVGVEGGLWAGNVHVDGPVVGCRVALSEIVGLDLAGVTAECFL